MPIPPGKNKHTGARATNIIWVREQLQQMVKEKRAKGHTLNKDFLAAFRYLLAIEGINADGKTVIEQKARKDRGGKKPASIKAPSLMDMVNPYMPPSVQSEHVAV